MKKSVLPYGVRHPIKNLRKRYPNIYLILKIASPAILTLIIIVLLASALIFYSIIYPTKTPEYIDPGLYKLYAFDFIWDGAKGDTMHGWYIRGSNDAPLIVLCHGYNTNRTEVIDLASVLHDNGYNVFLYNIRGHGKSPYRICSLGYYETKDLKLAIKKLSEMEEVDYKRIGIWGSSLGAFIALKAAEGNPNIKALVLDSIYPSIESFLNIRTSQILGIESSFVTFFIKIYYAIFFKTGFSTLDETFDYDKLKAKRVLFITGRDPGSYMLAKETRTIYTLFKSEDKEILPLPDSRGSILFGNEKKRYNNFVLKFFLKTLPPINNNNEEIELNLK